MLSYLTYRFLQVGVHLPNIFEQQKEFEGRTKVDQRQMRRESNASGDTGCVGSSGL